MPIATFILESDGAGNPPIRDVAVEVYTTDGEYVTGGTTDTEGEATFTLPVDSYHLMYFKMGLAILPRQPLLIEIIEDDPNTFTVTGHERVLPESTNPDKTKVSGYIRGAAGEPTKTIVMLSPVNNVLVMTSFMVLPDSRIEISSNDEGYFEFELLRGQTYRAVFRDVDEIFGTTPAVLCLHVPDLPGIDIDDLFFPVPVEVDFSTDELELVVGDPEDSSVTYTRTYSDNGSHPEGVPWSSIRIVNSAPEVADVVLHVGKLLITAKAAGTAVITTERVFNDLVYWKDPPDFSSDTLSVTVT